MYTYTCISRLTAPTRERWWPSCSSARGSGPRRGTPKSAHFRIYVMCRAVLRGLLGSSTSPNAPLNNNREALAAKLDYHLSNGVTIYMAFHTGAEAPSPFVPSDGRRSSEGHLIGTSLSSSSYQPQALYTIYLSNTPIPYPHTRTPQPPHTQAYMPPPPSTT